MSRLIYIDANIYLRFYDNNSKEYKKLLKSIEETKNDIFVTAQIVDEVERNKLEVFLKSFNEYFKQISVNMVSLPEHLETETDEKLKQWNKKEAEIGKDLEDQRKKLNAFTTILLRKISENSDEITMTFSKIFENAINPTEIQISKARNRKEVGNPPGKRSDPLGDQISWEQLLDVVDNVDNLWIISNDSDYIYVFDKICYLNPFLVKNLRQKNPVIEIHCFNTLAEGLKSFSVETTTNITTLPPDDLLDTIAKEEEMANKIQTIFSGASGDSLFSEAIHSSFIDDKNICPICRNVSLIGPSFRQSQHGGFTDQYFCISCKKYIDPGEFSFD
jgi:hypothetical protein